MITIEGLSKTYAGTGRPALNDIALQIPKGAIYGILGRSGAGKSTLIRCLNLLERPTSGRILVNGQDITQLNKAALRDYRLRTGMIFQHFNLLHARTVADNVAVPLEIAGVPRAAREARVRELLALVDIITPNETEAEKLTGIRVENDEDAAKAAQVLHEKGIRTVLITLGSRGVWASVNGEGQRVPGFRVQAVDTIAAGDTFNGALITALLEEKPLPEAIRFAHAAAAIAVTRKGAQPSVPWREEIDAFLDRQR